MCMTIQNSQQLGIAVYILKLALEKNTPSKDALRKTSLPKDPSNTDTRKTASQYNSTLKQGEELDGASKLESEYPIERVANFAPRLLAIKVLVNNDYKECYESNVRKIFQDLSGHLRFFHHFLGVMINFKGFKGSDDDEAMSEFTAFHEILSKSLGHGDKYFAEIHKIVTTEIENPMFSPGEIADMVQNLYVAVCHIYALAVDLEGLILHNAMMEKDSPTGEVLSEEDVVAFTHLREELSRAYTSLEKSGLGIKEELYY